MLSIKCQYVDIEYFNETIKLTWCANDANIGLIFTPVPAIMQYHLIPCTLRLNDKGNNGSFAVVNKIEKHNQTGNKVTEKEHKNCR